MYCVRNGRVALLPIVPDLRILKSRNFILTQFLKRKEIEVIFLKRAPRLSMREWKRYQAKLAEEYCRAGNSRGRMVMLLPVRFQCVGLWI